MSNENILERAKAAAKSLDYCPDFADEQQIILELIAEIERLRSELTTANVQLMAAGEMVCAKDARIKELEAGRIAYRNLGSKIEDLETYIERLEAAFLERFAQGIQAPKEKAELMAREALEQIRSSNHIVEANQMVLTAERREAVQYLIELATDGKYPPYPGGVLAEKIEILRSLLDGKAGGKDED